MNQGNQTSRFVDNPYQYTRGVQFRGNVDPKHRSEQFLEKIKRNSQEINLSKLAELLLKFHTDLKLLLYYTNSEKRQTGISQTYIYK